MRVEVNAEVGVAMKVEMSHDGRWVRVTIEGRSSVMSFEAWSYAIANVGKFRMG